MFYVIVSGKVTGEEDNKVMGLLITIKATYHVGLKRTKYVALVVMSVPATVFS